MAWESDIAYEHDGQTIRSSSYGGIAYVSEYLDVLASCRPGAPIDVLEWGSGLTSIATFRNREQLRCRSLLSIEHDLAFQRSVARYLPDPDYKVVHVDQVGPCRNQADVGLSYASTPFFSERQFDAIYIDGRRRMECAFNAVFLGDGSHTVIIHDYRRRRYQLIHLLYDVVSDGPQFRVLRPKKDAFRLVSREGLAALRGLDATFTLPPRK